MTLWTTIRRITVHAAVVLLLPHGFQAWSFGAEAESVAPVISGSVLLGSRTVPAVDLPRTLRAPARIVELAPGAVDTAVICPKLWRETLNPWLTYRAAQGHRVVLISQWRSANHLRTVLQQLAADHPLRYVLLVGDVPVAPGEDSGGAGLDVPTFYTQAKVNIRWGSEPDIATDHPYADLDGDQVPDVAVGRLPVQTAEELRTVLGKILRYETSEPMGDWRHRVNLVAGVGGFGPLADTVVEFAAKKLLTDGIPPEYDSKMAHSSWRSPYCPNPADMRRTTLGLHNEGCLFWVYMGHGHRQRLDRVRLPNGDESPILEQNDATLLSSQGGLPIAVMLACYAAAYDSAEDSLAEAMLKQQRGPVAVIGGSRVTMPYAMAILGTGMMKGVFEGKLQTVGDVFVHGKRSLYSPDGETPADQKVLDSLARAFSPTRDNLSGERIEHLHLFNLLGDPMTVVQQARPVGVRTTRYVTAGDTLRVQGQTDLAGQCTVELVCRRDRLTFAPPPRPKFDGSPETVKEMHQTFLRANDSRWAGRTLWVEPGGFQTTLTIPPQAKGPAHVRISVHGERDFGLGAVDVIIQPPVGGATASKPVLQQP